MILLEEAKKTLIVINLTCYARFIETHPNMDFLRNSLTYYPICFSKLLKYWREFPPKKEILRELAIALVEVRCINIKRLLIDHGSEFIDNLIYFSNGMEEYILGKIFEIEDIDYFYERYYDYYLRIKRYTKVNELDKKLKSMKKLENKIISSRERLEKLVASKKIVKYLEDAMYDEFEMKPLRTRIDMRKFEEIMKEENQIE